MNVFGRFMIMALFGLLATQAHAQYYGAQGQVVVCKSSGYQQNYCDVDTRGGVTLTRRLSDSACVEGRTWGADRRGIWVTQGCQAEFTLGDHYGGQGIRCVSNDYRQNYCRIDSRGGVRLVRQISNSACIRGRSWGYDSSGVWVSNGCEADFAVGYGPGDGPGPVYSPGPGYIEARVVRCESINGRTQRCNLDTRGGVRLANQLSNSGCYDGRTWGWDHDGIWVSNGCRADFAVGAYGRR
ncbi:MAG TPA: DUF3011 domain-containing protein [Xanthomonadaceae bacterium]|nr:DUF3011 domain-containing protein [Xanthomonadaceae bacterium]